MDYKIKWSPEAVEDLQAIAEYIERDSEFYARSVVTKILDISRNIKILPLAGRIVPEIGDDNIREQFVYSYRVVYQIEKSHIIIAAIIHGKQLFENVTDRF